WHAPVCNGPGKEVYDYALYSLQWTNRLRRFRPPSFGGLLGAALGRYLNSGELFRYVSGDISTLPGFEDLQHLAGGLGGEAGEAAAQDVFGFLQGKADEQLAAVRGRVIGKITGSGNGPTSLIIH